MRQSISTTALGDRKPPLAFLGDRTMQRRSYVANLKQTVP